MELPKANYYGVRCMKCPAIFWTPSYSKIIIMCTVAFQDKGLPFVEEDLGLVIGFGRFAHVCRPDLDEE